MERTIIGTVGEVKGRTVNTKYGEKTVFDITIGSQKTSTFKAGIAEEANALRGSDVEATVREEQKGDYTNYMLIGLRLVSPGAASSQTSTIPVTTAPAADTRQESIEKQNARTTAFTYAGHAGLDIDKAFELANRLYYWTPSQPSDPVAVGSAARTAEAAISESNDGIEW